ncbi:MAG: hypothetical protein KAT35_04780 [Candidatus Aenigmarchaeota archaeon]|nr:hypothetical protein [Candidatus Aenigmarchaeota archaeon]
MKAIFNTTTAFMIVAFGTLTFIFFGINAFMDITYSANVVSENIGLLNAVDGAHLVKTCLGGDSGIIEESDIKDIKSYCNSRFSGMGEIDYEYFVECKDLSISFKTPGYDHESTKDRHYLFINIHKGSDIYVGRLYVQTV